MKWEVVIPVKASSRAKSRLALSSTDPRLHAELVRAIQRDTIEAVLSARGLGANPVHRVWVVGTSPDATLDVRVIADPGGGLNRAVAHAAQVIQTETIGADPEVDSGIAVVVADLPCLLGEDLAGALALAGDHRRTFVRDWHATGTTMLTSRARVPLEPAFGEHSARRHAATGAVEIAAGATLRADIDTPNDLVRGGELGFGQHTSAFVRTHSVHCA